MGCVGVFGLPTTNSGWNLKDSIRARTCHDFEGCKAVVVGGGTGAPVSIKTLLAMGVQTSAVVAMADDGGSTGRLREKADAIPPGDIRKCLTAMAADPDDPMVAAFKYRFDYAFNHTLGNLILTALAETSSFVKAIEVCEGLLGALGHVYPSTLDRIRLVGLTCDGRELHGQSTIAHSGTAMRKVWLDRSDAEPYGPALEAIDQADLIVFGPGSLFTSIIPNLLVPGISEAIARSRARTLFLCSLADMQGETWGLDCSEHVQALLDHGAARHLDAVCLSCSPSSSPGEAADGGASGPDLDERPDAEYETVTTDPKSARTSPQSNSKTHVVRAVPADAAALDRIRAKVPVLITRDLRDTVYPTWHNPYELGEVFKGVLGLCRSQAR